MQIYSYSNNIFVLTQVNMNTAVFILPSANTNVFIFTSVNMNFIVFIFPSENMNYFLFKPYLDSESYHLNYLIILYIWMVNIQK